jgi:hypothetical protein
MATNVQLPEELIAKPSLGIALGLKEQPVQDRERKAYPLFQPRATLQSYPSSIAATR